MNRENLQKMSDYIRTIPIKKFNMRIYRKGKGSKALTHECQSIGCVVGHCTVLDSKPLPLRNNAIDFLNWSSDFTGIRFSKPEWDWCFSALWVHRDNTPEGAALRIEWLLKNGLPEDLDEQMYGEGPLCYLKNQTNP